MPPTRHTKRVVGRQVSKAHRSDGHPAACADLTFDGSQEAELLISNRDSEVQEDEEECYVCLEAMDRDSRAAVDCKHGVHEECIREMLGAGHELCGVCQRTPQLPYGLAQMQYVNPAAMFGQLPAQLNPQLARLSFQTRNATVAPPSAVPR
ncbi:hypothetical protein M427DRAFT_37585 [Gonapodya prolifera JEL478]|uniref:RING-type domain-containing protein n=1 Tax=Gonapodya prolifera (strain JEL478) TaxID=1344416 RepID=A0A139A0F6_GONPJ|nr:hypothetical protein M427DRAFT_37585 [Gonapodya prolifera JEL478]|eukprot:KXS10204.1 hypothetical protein M427DRAFT_37585 [Gonapodya prolifera JEL478]